MGGSSREGLNSPTQTVSLQNFPSTFFQWLLYLFTIIHYFTIKHYMLSLHFYYDLVLLLLHNCKLVLWCSMLKQSNSISSTFCYLKFHWNTSRSMSITYKMHWICLALSTNSANAPHLWWIWCSSYVLSCLRLRENSDKKRYNMLFVVCSQWDASTCLRSCMAVRQADSSLGILALIACLSVGFR